jgi:hypothetical protein
MPAKMSSKPSTKVMSGMPIATNTNVKGISNSIVISKGILSKKLIKISTINRIIKETAKLPVTFFVVASKRLYANPVVLINSSLK